MPLLLALPYSSSDTLLFHYPKPSAASFFKTAASAATTLSPAGLSPPERSEHNPPPSGGHNPRAGGPLTLTPKVCPRAKPPPQPLNYRNPGRRAAHTAAPFRLAALATHPRKGGGQVKRRRGPYSLKFAASAATTTLGLKGRQTYEPSGRQAGPS